MDAITKVVKIGGRDVVGPAQIVRDGGSAIDKTQLYASSANASSTPLAITGVPATGKAIVIDDLLICTDTAMSLTIRTTGGTVFAKIYVFGSAPAQITFRNGLVSPTVSLAVEVLASVSGNISTTTSYHTV